ncbi:site-specific DNA-methyltransferase [Spirosoma fluviale]|nr:site-specific DNA-methyltransferase [Spirosoma fluviale]
MPTLTWIGKDKVVNHHHDVPFRVLDQQYTYGQADSRATDRPNRIIHGDNLEALKALLPYYEGRIKCIYIDPPYNTGNENWVYNDNVSDPKLKRWLGKVVGKESEDLSRHDKWLCMMYPRLQLLHRLLADDGAIFVSIDDNEQASLKLMMDEIWGDRNFITTIIWHKMDSPKNTAIHFSEDHDYIAVYAKDSTIWRPKKLPRTDAMNARYKNPDNDPRGPWLLSDLAARNFYSLGQYPITTKIGRIIQGPPAGSYWRISREKFDQLDKDNRIYWGKNGDNRPGVKRFLTEVQDGVVPQTLWHWKDVGSTRNSKQELSKVMSATSNEDLFITPKPSLLIERILQIATGPNDIILDSFAGSGTTAHAVLNLNKQDAGNRQFILVEMEDYAETITAERVRRVIDGYGDKEGTGGSFTYYELGPALFTDDGQLNEALPPDRIREYIWYSETRTPFSECPFIVTESPHFLGKLYETAYYFYFEPDDLTTLDYDFLSTIQTVAEQYVIYADNCLVGREWLQQRHIIFKKIPRDISRF